MPEYRPVPEERVLEYQRILDYAFRPEGGPRTEAELAETAESERAGLGERRALFDGEEMLCTCAHHRFSARLRGEWHDLGGVSAVATPPEHRRGGLVRELLAAALAEYRDRSIHVSALWPFDHGFYRRLGWAVCNRYATIECEPGALAFADAARSGRFRRAEPDDWPALDPVHRAAGEGYALWLQRTEEWWRHRVFEGWEEEPFVYAFERDGEVEGYVVYRIAEGDDGRRLRVAEMAATDHEARRNLLRFCYDHDSQVETVRFFDREEARLLDWVEDPAALDVELSAGPMFRLVDVARALSNLAYPDGVEGEVVLSVSDSVADWNDGTFALSVADGEATCEPAAAADPAVTADVTALSQLAVGYRTVEALERTAGFSVADPDAGEFLAAAFPEEQVFLSDGF